MNVLEQFGVSAGSLADMTAGYNYPKVTPGRVCHIDADFLSYQVSAESKAEMDPSDPTPRKSFEDMCHNASVAIDHITRLAGAERFHLHTTPSGSTKGGRGNQAALKEYQANRKDRDNKPEFLDQVRAWLISENPGTAHLDQEADDGMAQAAWQAYRDKEQSLCVIASKDKDLRMVPGLLMPDDAVCDRLGDGTFGFIELDRTKSSPKVTGRGTKFFWAQLIMGDTADNISGLPKLAGLYKQKFAPTKQYEKDLLDGGEAAQTRIIAEHKKLHSCGPVITFDLIDPLTNDRDAYQFVKELWVGLERTGYEFTHWRTGQTITATQALLSDMLLLWMRRNKNRKDVIEWLKETVR